MNCKHCGVEIEHCALYQPKSGEPCRGYLHKHDGHYCIKDGKVTGESAEPALPVAPPPGSNIVCVAGVIADALHNTDPIHRKAGVAQSGAGGEQCSCTAPHAAHTFGGRPVKFCPGIETEWKRCDICGRDNSAATWERLGRCPNCDSLEKEFWPSSPYGQAAATPDLHSINEELSQLMFDVQSLHPDNVQKRIKAICEKLDKLEASPEDGAWPSAEQWLKSREMEDYFVYYHINKKLSQLLTEYAAHVKKK